MEDLDINNPKFWENYREWQKNMSDNYEYVKEEAGFYQDWEVE